MMIQEIATVDRIPEYIKRANDRNDSFGLVGFGHRVYKSYDPRARIMQKTCHEVLDAVGNRNDPILQVALEHEKIALNDHYFIEKKLYPNIGIALKALGFPTEMFTALFAIARIAGWVAQWKEMIEGRYSASAGRASSIPAQASGLTFRSRRADFHSLFQPHW